MASGSNYTIEQQTQMLIDGDWGSASGMKLAGFLDRLGRRDVVEEFYRWLAADRANGGTLLIHWIKPQYPDLYIAFKAQQRVLG
jgi:hypothetical protein